MQRYCCIGVIGLQSRPERSQPEPVAWADPLTHFLSPAVAHCQGEPLMEGRKEGKEGRRSNRRVKGKEGWWEEAGAKESENESEKGWKVKASDGAREGGSLVFVSCLRPGTAATANSSQPRAPGFPLNIARHYYANFRQASHMHARTLKHAR